jgi:dephospho-CoA kinase
VHASNGEGVVLKVGLTGNIASGKSSVARVWMEAGAEVVDADVLARRAVEPGSPALHAIVERWGPAVLDGSGSLDRARMRGIVFTDPGARSELEAIVHPEVAALREAAFREAAARGAPVVVADIPLLFEVGMEHEFDRIVLVDAPEAERERRLVEDRGLDPAEARRMIHAQRPSAGKRPLADYLIENAGSPAELEAAALDVWRRILQEAGDD